jgi:thiamine pyrophosphate-dependent acetolactate synthase large subunit-like protein
MQSEATRSWSGALEWITKVIEACAELHFLRLRQQPVTKSVFPDVDFAPIAESFGFEAATIRTLEDLHKLAAKLRKPDGPIFLDCKINAEVAAPFMSEFAQFEGR